MNMNQKVKAGYNLVAKSYSSEFRDQFKNDKYLSELVATLPPHATILDVGCGAGKPIDSFLISKGVRVIGIDISESQIELAKTNVPEGNFEVKDMSELADGEYQVDAVVSFYAIFHTPREQHLDILKKFRSFLKSNGYLLVTMGAHDWEGKEDDFCGTEMHWSHYGAAKNLQLVEQAGFTIINSEIDRSGNEEHLVIFAITI